MTDCYYTPTSLANHLISFIPNVRMDSIADFCIGDGELLRAASRRWKKSKFYGTDISQEAISKIKTKHCNWIVSKADFLNEKSREQSNVLKRNPKFNLILLNPPFSCLGGTTESVTFNSRKFEVSTSMHFLITATKFLASTGSIYAILPNSVAYSQKDQKIWKALGECFNVKILEESNTLHFDKCSARVILISIDRKKEKSISVISKYLRHDLENLSFFRGKQLMHGVDKSLRRGPYLLHSTNLQNNSLINIHLRSKNKFSEVSGPAVLIPRVGVPKKSKICCISSNQRYVLSDCIIAIKTRSDADCIRLQQLLINNYKELNNLYKGTGARYITLERLQYFILGNKSCNIVTKSQLRIAS